jgi:type VI secretion system protein ImpH
VSPGPAGAPLDLAPLGLPAEIPPGDAAARIEAARRLGAYPLMQLLERLLGTEGRVGTDARPGEERVRFRHDPSMAFRPGEVTAVSVRELPADPTDFTARPRAVLEVVTTFLGLTGAASPLPPYLAEEVAQEDADAPRRRDFLDMFHHRALSLFLRARARSDWPNGYRSDQGDAWSRRVLALIGVEEPGRLPAPAWQLLRWAPLLAEPALTGAALEAILEDALADDLRGARVEVEGFAGGWVEIAPDERCRLGVAGASLGSDLLLGRRIFDRSGRYRVLVGPLSREGFAAFAREKEPLRRMGRAIRAVGGDPLDVEVLLWLSKEAAPHLELGRARLGRDAFLGGQVRESRLKVEIPA